MISVERGSVGDDLASTQRVQRTQNEESQLAQCSQDVWVLLLLVFVSGSRYLYLCGDYDAYLLI